VKERLARIVDSALQRELPKFCDACEADIRYERYGDPIEAVVKALLIEFSVCRYDDKILCHHTSNECRLCSLFMKESGQLADSLNMAREE